MDFSRQFPALPHAPIAEAVLHWQAAASVEMDDALLYERLSERFPNYGIAPQHDIETALAESEKGVEVQQWAVREGFRLTKTENGRLVSVCQFKRNGIIFSQLRPYRTWDGFAGEAIRFWAAFLEIARPDEVARISTRFISQIPIASIQEAGEYVDIAEDPLALTGAVAEEFFHQVTLKLAGVPYAVNLIRTVQPGQAESMPFSLIVDIDVETTEGTADFDLVPEKLRDLRFIKNEVFFTVMKDAESRFGEPAA